VQPPDRLALRRRFPLRAHQVSTRRALQVEALRAASHLNGGLTNAGLRRAGNKEADHQVEQGTPNVAAGFLT
jgi:hypothetical protein